MAAQVMVPAAKDRAEDYDTNTLAGAAKELFTKKYYGFDVQGYAYQRDLPATQSPKFANDPYHPLSWLHLGMTPYNDFCDVLTGDNPVSMFVSGCIAGAYSKEEAGAPSGPGGSPGGGGSAKYGNVGDIQGSNASITFPEEIKLKYEGEGRNGSINLSGIEEKLGELNNTVASLNHDYTNNWNELNKCNKKQYEQKKRIADYLEKNNRNGNVSVSIDEDKFYEWGDKRYATIKSLIEHLYMGHGNFRIL